jgi:ferritin
MLTQSLTTVLNAELTRERTAVATYMAMAGLFQFHNLLGFQAWGMENSHEESEHAEKFFDYLCDRDVVPDFEPVEAISLPKAQELHELTVAILGQALALEKTVTEAIKQIYAQAESEEDNATLVFLHPFITEQVKSEHDLETMIGYLKDTGMVGLVAMNAKLEKA